MTGVVPGMSCLPVSYLVMRWTLVESGRSRIDSEEDATMGTEGGGVLLGYLR